MSIEAMKQALETLRQAIEEAEKREWIGLTDEERFTANYNLDPYKHALEIEAKLKEKNT